MKHRHARFDWHIELCHADRMRRRVHNRLFAHFNELGLGARIVGFQVHCDDALRLAYSEAGRLPRRHGNRPTLWGVGLLLGLLRQNIRPHLPYLLVHLHNLRFERRSIACILIRLARVSLIRGYRCLSIDRNTRTPVWCVNFGRGTARAQRAAEARNRYGS